MGQRYSGSNFRLTWILGIPLVATSVGSVHLGLEGFQKCTFHAVHFTNLQLLESILLQNQYGQPWTVYNTSRPLPARAVPLLERSMWKLEDRSLHLDESRFCNVHLLVDPSEAMSNDQKIAHWNYMHRFAVIWEESTLLVHLNTGPEPKFSPGWYWSMARSFLTTLNQTALLSKSWLCPSCRDLFTKLPLELNLDPTQAAKLYKQSAQFHGRTVFVLDWLAPKQTRCPTEFHVLRFLRQPELYRICAWRRKMAIFVMERLNGTVEIRASGTEEKEFREGRASTRTLGQQNEDLAIECLPYQSEFEILKEDFLVDFNSVSGSGAYGIVFKGCIRKNSDRIQVAVKTVPQNVEIEYFKALLSELKILAYIGHHENIVNLIGAYTENIKNRELYVGVELCDKSLLQYLRDNQHTFLRHEDSNYENQLQLTSTNEVYQNGILIDDSWTFSTLDLIRWSGQIANGMEFLSEKRVVHGDLAARNVLLSFERNVKICDFGLARQLIDYNYIKTKQCPLPWKWMAIESLANMKFSTTSDVWAYGVTLWEIFSLGRVPYAGLAWNVDFIDQLMAGLRMTRPAYAGDRIFCMMTECWDPDPVARPSFEALKQFFLSPEINAVAAEAGRDDDGYLEPNSVPVTI